MKEHDKWRDHNGNLVSDVSPEDSIQTRVKTVTTSTKDTPILYQVARVVGVCLNHIASLFQKIVDKDGKIPTDQQVSDIREALRTAYFESLTGDNPAEAFTSEDEGSKAERVETAANARAQKLDKFHPMDLYLYFHFGPASVGGSGSPYFLETAEAIQKAVKEAAISNRSELRKKNEEDLDQEAKQRRGNTANHCSSTAWKKWMRSPPRPRPLLGQSIRSNCSSRPFELKRSDRASAAKVFSSRSKCWKISSPVLRVQRTRTS